MASRFSIIKNLSAIKDFRNEYEAINCAISCRWGIVGCRLGANVHRVALARRDLRSDVAF